MKKLQNFLPTAKLKHIIHLKPITASVPRCRLTFALINMYRQLEQQIRNINEDDTIDMLPSNHKKKVIDKFYDLLKELYSVIKHFQS